RGANLRAPNTAHSVCAAVSHVAAVSSALHERRGMHGLKRKTFVVAVLAAAVLSVGVAAASAHGGPGGGGRGLGGVSVSSLVTKAASQLSVTRAKLVTAIQDSAATHISNA